MNYNFPSKGTDVSVIVVVFYFDGFNLAHVTTLPEVSAHPQASSSGSTVCSVLAVICLVKCNFQRETAEILGLLLASN